ncbi:1,2-phenylacetyl-CoA epoxidase subunit PaaD [Falsiroseomonas ponticola]|uniref:1,2-phenylacetyl-CoA epoxidase subunit PaaD n=1 Tax=Falsiroseomonas ponticola TaxID=2786951 RepID=UPI00193326EC|nr:1,2-phenylacetyl-CoA epoxidase subunit PaaD [Roseomonas ponticola]
MSVVTLDLARARAIAGAVVDPEIPVLGIGDLGVLRDVRMSGGGVEVDITPTYSGCPAMNVIAWEVEAALASAGFPQVRVRLVLSPAWTTDWITEAGRQALRDYGIAPPAKRAGRRALFGADDDTPCPRCGSAATEKLSEFGSTACKALWRCTACREPFDAFKCL